MHGGGLELARTLALRRKVKRIMKARWPLLALSLLSITPGCIQQERAPRSPRFVSVPPAAPVTQPSPSAPLPSGWAWPLDLRNVAAALAQPGIVRPLDLSQLVAAAGRGPCAPTEVAPHVWFAPDCSGSSRPAITSSPFVQQRALSSSTIALPSEVDLRRQGLDGPVKYQQMVGVCWAFAVSTAMDNALRRAGNSDVVAPMHVIAADPWRDIWAKGHSSKALTLEAAWPYDPVKACKLNESPSEVWCEKAYHVKPGSWRSDPSLVEEVARANQSGVYTITRAESVQTSNTTQMASVLASGQSIYAAFDYNKDAWGAVGSGGSVIPDYERGEGGHAVVIVGFRTRQNGRQFLLHNSWGTEWRDGGYAWISEAMVRRHLKEAFTLEVSAPLGNARPSGQTPNGQSPADAGCAPGQARDTVLGWCAPACPGGSAPTATFCPAAGAKPTGCAAGQVRNWLTGSCEAACRNGLPPIAGVCLS